MGIKSAVAITTLLLGAAPGGIAQPFMSVQSPGLRVQAPACGGCAPGITSGGGVRETVRTFVVAPAPGFSDAGPVRVDFTGKLFKYVDDAGTVILGPVEVNGYGYGVHRDQYGRAVRAMPIDGAGGTLLLPR